MELNIFIIRKYIKENRLTIKQFCAMCKISYKTLRKLLKGQQNVKISSLFKIARTLKIELYKLFN